MNGFIINVERATIENTDFRRVLYTAKHSQLVVMNILPGEDIGEEIHQLDQFIRIEQGEAKAVLNDIEHAMKTDDAVVIPQGVKHNIINTGTADLKLYTIYSPPEHQDKIVRHTKQQALAEPEEFDGATSE